MIFTTEAQSTRRRAKDDEKVLVLEIRDVCCVASEETDAGFNPDVLIRFYVSSVPSVPLW